ncbi:ribitol kinase [Tremella mesenterica]|uniref:Ribitol kinase n=1 Tax=Tremella mesenterica TaxID=5217 RepID=A0A4Q1B7Z1_TREME|nr:ribitol kinase [Tremella mesenterica]
MDYYIGFDVGTGSGRACLVDKTGKLIAEHTEPTQTHRSPTDHRIFEQSTNDIWSALSKCSKTVLSESGISPSQVKGIGFDATCSLAVTDKQGKPVSVSRTGASEDDESDENLGKEGEWNIVLWADHRAEVEAEEINASGEGVLQFVGKTMSLEMEVPKTLWLLRHMKRFFADCMFFDLPDYLTYKATGSLARSNCSLACKFSYVPPGAKMTHDCDGTEEVSKDGWSGRFFKKIGLDSMVENDFEQLGGIPGKNGLVLTAGQPVGKGLSKEAAQDLGLEEGCAVGSGVIDAYAGWIGTVGAASALDDGKVTDIPSFQHSGTRLAAIAGTSTCYIAQSEEGILVPGVWGPYLHAVFPGSWMNEGGQSSTGQLIDFVMQTHPAYPKLVELSKSTGKNVFALLAERLEIMQKEHGAETLTHLTKDLHFYPDMHGNRSPLADPKMRGMLTGIELSDSLNDLARKFNVTLEAICLQTRHIVDEMNAKGHRINSIYMSGSQAKNSALMRLLATVLNMPVVIPPQPSAAVPLGAAMLGRFAHEISASRQDTPFKDQQDALDAGKKDGLKLWDIMVEMTQAGKRIEPRTGKEGEREKKLLEVKYKIFREAVDVQRRWRDMVAEAIKE